MKRQGVDKYFKKMQFSLNFRIGHANVFTTSIYTEITGIDTRGFMEQVK
jgi:hypothetical protein